MDSSKPGFDFNAFVEDDDVEDWFKEDFRSAEIAVHGEDHVVDPFQQQRHAVKGKPSHHISVAGGWDVAIDENNLAPFDEDENRDEGRLRDFDEDGGGDLATSSLLHGATLASGRPSSSTSSHLRVEFEGEDDDKVGEGEGNGMEMKRVYADEDYDEAIDEEIRARTESDEKRLKYKQTMVYCGTYIAQGLAGGCVGPTLLLLAENTSSSVDDMGLIFTTRGLGWIAGSLMAGRLYESSMIAQAKRSHMLLFISTLSMALFLFIFPFARSLWLLLLLQGINALLASFNDVGANTLMFQVWQRDVAPYMQFLHFSYGVGSTSAPAIIALVLIMAPSDAQLRWCYWVLGCIVMLPSFFALFIPSPEPISSPKSSSDDSQQGDGPKSVWLSYVITLLTAFSLFTYVGIEIAYGGWIFTYAVQEFHMNETEADYLSSAFWLAITIGRLLAVPLATRISSRWMLLVDHIGSTLAIALAIVVVPFKNNLLLWLVTFGYGISMASIYALVFSFPYQLGVAITSRASSLFVVGSSMGAMLVPMAAGFIFQTQGASWLMWIIFIGNILLIGAYLVLAVFLPRFMGIKVISSIASEKDQKDSAMSQVLREDDDEEPYTSQKGVFQLLPLRPSEDDHL